MCLAAAFAAAWDASAFAASDPVLPDAPALHRVLILADKPGDPFMNRVKAEVTAVRGLEVIMEAPAGSLDASARAAHAEAAIRKAPSGKGVEVWMADATSGRSLLRQLVVDESPDGPDQSLIALQAAELLRTGFFPKRDASPPSSLAPRPPATPPTVVAAPPAPALGESALEAGIGILHSRGGVGPALQAWLSYQRFWSRHFGIGVDLSAPLARGSVSDLEGTADIGALFAGASLHARWKSGGGRMFVATSLGGAFAAVLANGQPTANLVGASTSAYTGLAYIRLSGGVRPISWLGLGVAGILGTTTSRVRIQFASHDVAEWGMPVAAALIYGEADWR
jgi:hypothetical protein